MDVRHVLLSLLTLWAASFTETAYAQTTVPKRNRVEAQAIDSLRELARRSRSSHAGGDSIVSPTYSSLFFYPTFYMHPVNRAILLRPSADTCRSHEAKVTDRASQAWNWVYTHAPHLIREADTAADTTQATSSTAAADSVAEVKPELNLAAIVTDSLLEADTPPLTVAGGVEDLKVVPHRPNFWTLKASEVSLQFLQCYISSNWHKGGESNNSLQASAILEANYNNKQKITFDNKLEMKLGFQNTRGDDLHKYKTNSDMIRMTNKLGLRATSRWYYTAQLQSWTQFYPGYKSNDEKVYSDFMSPFETVFSIGMEYKLNVKNFNLTANISPLAFDYKYVDRLGLSTSFGLRENKHEKFEYGAANMTINYTWNMFKNVSWTGRIYYYTNYEKVQVEWENTINLTINRFLTTQLFLYPRFDDGATRQEGKSYFQFYQQLSLGFRASF